MQSDAGAVVVGNGRGVADASGDGEDVGEGSGEDDLKGSVRGTAVGLTVGVAADGSNVGRTSVGLQAVNKTKARRSFVRDTDFMTFLLLPDRALHSALET